ncbi:MAG TPA: hypothetical protein VEU07_05790 [Candidatus Acidoferrum sp.]|nr:hypothetical protein [Candidatus Acidoferrum sp.]
MEMSVVDLVTYLENDFAEHYARLKVLPPFRAVKDILQHMEDECRGHAQQATRISRTHALPSAMSLGGILELQTRIKRLLSEAILQHPEPAALCTRLADAEATVALLYRSIADRFRSPESPQVAVAAEFDRLAAEELLHRDAMLKAAADQQSG